MADLMKKLKTGKLSALSQQTIHPLEDYEVTDIAEGGITNEQMTLALDESAGSFFKIGSVYLCIDEGTYTKHCFYKWNGIDASTPWEVVGSFDSKQDKLTAGTNITIDENNVISASTEESYTEYTNVKMSTIRNEIYTKKPKKFIIYCNSNKFTGTRKKAEISVSDGSISVVSETNYTLSGPAHFTFYLSREEVGTAVSYFCNLGKEAKRQLSLSFSAYNVDLRTFQSSDVDSSSIKIYQATDDTITNSSDTFDIKILD